MIPFATSMLQRSAVVAGAADPHWSNVVFLNGWNGTLVPATGAQSASGPEESSFAHVGTANANTYIVETGRFGNRCLASPGGMSAGLLTYPDNAAFALGSGAFTIEVWVNFTVSPASNFHYFVAQYDTGAGQRSWSLLMQNGSLQMLLSATGSAGTAVASSAWAPSTEIWYHVVGEFDGTAYRTYVDGVMKAKSTTLVTPLLNSTAALSVGSALNSGARNGDFWGFLDEVRITKGVARYASDSGYTVPTAAFPRG